MAPADGALTGSWEGDRRFPDKRIQFIVKRLLFRHEWIAFSLLRIMAGWLFAYLFGLLVKGDAT
jgi:hypothetical protein